MTHPRQLQLDLFGNQVSGARAPMLPSAPPAAPGQLPPLDTSRDVGPHEWHDWEIFHGTPTDGGGQW